MYHLLSPLVPTALDCKEKVNRLDIEQGLSIMY